MRSFGIYLHVPFCRVHCPYCDFVVVAGSSWPERRYVSALLAEIAHRASLPPWREATVATIYFGGGTPSLFAAESIERILAEIRARFAIAPDVEITLEANPENAHAGRLRPLRALGVNRLSIGIQSFSPKLLKTLGRIATARDTLRAVPEAREGGFENLSLDLIFAVPGETLDDWRADLERAVALRPEHLSVYDLTYEPATPLFALRDSGRLVAVDEDSEAAMFLEARERLAAAGYDAYEVSSFALPGRQSRHNSNYWLAGAYLGVGAGAHSYEPDGPRGRRCANDRDVARYVDRVLATGDAVATEESLDERQSASEFVFLGLRRTEGFSQAYFRERFARDARELFPRLDELAAEGLLERSDDLVRLSPRGLVIADSVLSTLL